LLTASKLSSAIDDIAQVDEDLSNALSTVGYPEPRNRSAGFETLVSTVVSQQLSTKAADTIFSRVKAAVPELSPRGLLSTPNEDLRGAGLSGRKVEYLRGLAEATISGEFDPVALESMDDEEAIQSIVQLRGFGKWTAKIYLMFSLSRNDIFPEDDLALLIALQHLKRLDERPSPSQALDLTLHWSPNRSAGSLFLWKYYRCKVRPESRGI
jgi:DNA-3-methyladenine glycosylase II